MMPSNHYVNKWKIEELSDQKEFEKHLNKVLSTNDTLKKEATMAGDFNMNLIDFEQNIKVQNFLNIMFGHSMVPIKSKLTPVTKNTATAIDHISINSVTTTKFKRRNYKIRYFASFANVLCGRLQYSCKRNKGTLHI